MLKYTLKRLAQSLVTIFLAVTLVFLLLRLLPTDYFFTEDQLMKFTEEQKNAQLQLRACWTPLVHSLFAIMGSSSIWTLVSRGEFRAAFL